MEITLSANQDPPALSCLVLFAQKGTKNDAKTNMSCRKIMLNYHQTTWESSKLCFTHKLLMCSCKWWHKRMIWFKKTLGWFYKASSYQSLQNTSATAPGGQCLSQPIFQVQWILKTMYRTSNTNRTVTHLFLINSHTNRRAGLWTMEPTSMQMEFTVSHKFLT